MAIVRLSITVRGRVQGVFFRKYTQAKAQELGLHGYVMNQPDGAVYIVAEGETAYVRELKEWCYAGSPASSVQTVTEGEAPEGVLPNPFSIRK